MSYCDHNIRKESPPEPSKQIDQFRDCVGDSWSNIFWAQKLALWQHLQRFECFYLIFGLHSLHFLEAQFLSLRFYMGQDGIRCFDWIFFNIQHTTGYLLTILSQKSNQIRCSGDCWYGVDIGVES